MTGSAPPRLPARPSGADSRQPGHHRPGAELGTVSHYDIQPVIDIYANVNGTDLGTRDPADGQDHRRNIARNCPAAPSSSFAARAIPCTSRTSACSAAWPVSILLVYLLIVVNFQSWLDPFLIISALPAALAGIVWFLFLTDTRLSVPALTGAIMCMGVATSNSILVVSFAREQLEAFVGDARKAALNAGFVRFRPVLMTALAMIIGMVPMALGLGDGGEQNAPLGRAVIGGLLLATVATLFFVPSFSQLCMAGCASAGPGRLIAERPRPPLTTSTPTRSNLK